MPNLLMVAKDDLGDKPQPYKVGQLLIYPYSKSKKVENRLVQVTAVKDVSFGVSPNRVEMYEYAIRYLNGSISPTARYYKSFAEYREGINQKIHAINKSLNNQYEHLKLVDALEATGKKVFNVKE